MHTIKINGQKVTIKADTILLYMQLRKEEAKEISSLYVTKDLEDRLGYHYASLELAYKGITFDEFKVELEKIVTEFYI